MDVQQFADPHCRGRERDVALKDIIFFLLEPVN